jgi:hypothetical protein
MNRSPFGVSRQSLEGVFREVGLPLYGVLRISLTKGAIWYTSQAGLVEKKRPCGR